MLVSVIHHINGKKEMNQYHHPVAKSCPILWDPMDHHLPVSSVHGILQARILEWLAISFSRRSAEPRDRTQIFSCIAGEFFYWLSLQESPIIILVGEKNSYKN